ncbi:MAG: hypothetical protein ACM3VT_01155 [Solirubrobacterales bacterium]
MANQRESLSPFGSFLFPHIFRSFRMAVQPSKLAVAFTALTILCITGWLMDLSQTVVVSNQRLVSLPGGIAGQWPRDENTELDAYLRSEAELKILRELPRTETAKTGVFSTLWRFADAELLKATGSLVTLDIRQFSYSVSNGLARCGRAVVWAFRYHTAYSIVLFAVALAVMSMAGGAISRMAALEFARDRRMRICEAFGFARRRFPSFIAAPIAPLIIAFLLGLPIIVLGALGNIPYIGELLTGLLLPFALVLAPFIAVLVLGAAAGVGLLFPAIAYEDSDFFDAIGRCVSCVYAKPWRLGFYTLLATVYGAVCYLFVRFFTFALLAITYGFLSLGLSDAKLEAIWPQPGFFSLLGAPAAATTTWSLGVAAFLIRIWTLGVAGLMVSFLVSFYFNVSAVIYALMRNRVDGTELDEIYEPAEEGPAAEQTVDIAPETATGTTSE